MAKTFDATLNSLIDEHLSDWAAFLAARVGVSPGPASALDTDLSFTLQADRLFRVDGTSPAAIHLELESSGRLGIPEELLRYNIAAWTATGLPVYSVLVLLRPKATATDLQGLFTLGAASPPYLTFQYTVIRVAQETVDGMLEAGPGLAPLAMLTNEASANLPAAFTRFQEQLKQSDVPANVAKSLYGSTFVLCGLRYDTAQIEKLYRDLSMTLEDSTTYQLILQRGEARGRAEGLAEGAVSEAHRILLAQGRKRFGPATESTETAVRGIIDRDRLQRIAERILDAADWNDLLATP